MLLFTSEDHERVRRGEITVTWRLWKYAHVKPGKVYASGFGGAFEILEVTAVPARDITDAEAKEAGHADAKVLIDYARSHTGGEVSPETPLYRVRFRYLEEAPSRPEVSLEEAAARVARLDRASKTGAWTEDVLRLIEANPGVASRYLAPQVGWEQMDFKTRVRKLKNLGLTVSLGTGYELSPLGQALLDTLSEDA